MDNRTGELTAAAQALDLLDPDMLKLAKPELPPAAAVRDLRQRFPGAFASTAPASNSPAGTFGQPPVPEPPKQFSEMSPSEQGAFCKKHKMPPPKRITDRKARGLRMI